MKKVALISLGCSKNLVDSELILGLLKKNKIEIVDNIEESDIIIINTCGFIESAKINSLSTKFLLHPSDIKATFFIIYQITPFLF